MATDPGHLSMGGAIKCVCNSVQYGGQALRFVGGVVTGAVTGDCAHYGHIVVPHTAGIHTYGPTTVVVQKRHDDSKGY
jgi:hypothetical protein